MNHALKAFAAALFLLSMTRAPAHAIDNTVDTTLDPAVSFPVTLRYAIEQVNLSGAPSNNIYFAIPGGSITLGSPLPAITSPLSILNNSGGTVTILIATSNPVFASDSSLSFGGSGALNISANKAAGSFVYGVASDTSNLNIGSISSLVTIRAQAGTNAAFALYSEDDVTIAGDMAGTLVATAGGKLAAGILATGCCGAGALTIGGALSGSVTATASSADSAYGLSSFDLLSIGSVSAAARVTAQAATHDAYGLFSSTDLTITGDMAGTISATAGTSYAYGMYTQSVDLSIGGALSGVVSATAGAHTAVGIQSGGTLNGGSGATPLLITGSVSATANGLAVAVASVNAMNLTVSGTLSGVDISGGGAGYAIRAGASDGAGGWTPGSADNVVTLRTGAKLTGIVDLGSGNNTLTVIGSGAASNRFLGVTNLVAGDGATSTNWTLNPSAANASTFGNLTVNANAALSVNEYVTIQGDTQNNGSLTFDIGTAKTYSGVISGSGSVTKAGSGVMYLRGNNTYTGGTYLNAGVLNVVSDANLGDPSGILVFNGGTLQTSASITSARSITVNSGGAIFDSNGYDSTLSGVISGPGAWTKTGAGVLYLRGNNTYTGGTSLNGGILDVVSDANLGNPSAPLAFNGGVLRTSAPLTTWRPITVSGGGGIIDNAGNNLTLNGTFSGSGPYTQTGSGTVTMAGNGAGYTGQALLNAGTLIVHATGSLGGTLTTMPGTTLGGHGTLGHVNNNGLVSPGGSIGTLNVAGNYAQGSKAVFLDEIDPTGRGDLLNVGGSVQLNGGFLFVSAPMAYYPTGALWPVITSAGGQTGSFAGVAQDFPSRWLRFLPVYTSSQTLVTAWRAPYAGFAANARAASAGWGLTKGAYAASGAFSSTILAFDLADPFVIASSLDQLHPEPYDAFTQSGFDSGRLVTASIQGRLSSQRTGDTQSAFSSPFDVSPIQALAFNELTQGAAMAAKLDAQSSFGIFLQPFGMTARQGATEGGTAYGYNSWGLLGGLDFTMSKSSVVGVFGGYSGRNLRLSAPANDGGKADTAFIGGYYTYHTDKWFAESSLRMGLDSYKARRAVSSPAGSSKVGASWNGWNVYANVGAGYDWHAEGWVLSPLGAVELARIAQNGYGESGGGSLGLRVHPRADVSVQSSLGFKVARRMEFGWGMLIPEVRVVWRHEWINGSRDIVANFQGFENTRFTTKTVPQASDWAAVSVGIVARCANNLSLTARVSTDLFRQDYQALAGSLGLRYSF